MIYRELDDFRRGDIIKITLLDDVLLNYNYKDKEGEVTEINYSRGTLKGTWGSIELYPESDDIEIVKPINDNPR